MPHLAGLPGGGKERKLKRIGHKIKLSWLEGDIVAGRRQDTEKEAIRSFQEKERGNGRGEEMGYPLQVLVDPLLARFLNEKLQICFSLENWLNIREL